eukprot:scaffold218582_cov31-Tisochrysis_lutea.AAC.1
MLCASLFNIYVPRARSTMTELPTAQWTVLLGSSVTRSKSAPSYGTPPKKRWRPRRTPSNT